MMSRRFTGRRPHRPAFRMTIDVAGLSDDQLIALAERLGVGGYERCPAVHDESQVGRGRSGKGSVN